ncbi:MAG: 2-oxo acid dehydrogenase subunit E2 [Anaerolineae bacterium]|nr:2-oxo acid dehydrogenase subunit E2 [Anaerolineae bacterium]
MVPEAQKADNVYTVVMPKLGLIMTEALLVEWRKKEGEWVDKGEVLFAMESDKSTLEIEAPASGYVHILVAAGEVVPVQTPICLISDQLQSPKPVVEQLPRVQEVHSDVKMLKQPDTISVSDIVPRVAASPKARTLARRLNLDLTKISASGPKGMIVSNDVANASKQKDAPSETLPLSGLRAVIAERLSASWRERPQVTLVTEIDATDLVSARSQIQLETGKKLSYNAFFMAAVARALYEHPYVNAHLEKDGLCRMEAIHIGIAVDTPRGLMVPVVRDVDHKGLLEIDDELKRLAANALEGRSTPDELSGGTFTITNLGQFGIDAFTPIINPPEAAILGVGRISPRPFVFNGQLAVRETVTLSLSFDHRLLDGAPAARFLQRVSQLLERPVLLYSHKFGV